VSPDTPRGSGPRFLIVDGANCVYRAFFAPFRDLRAADGTPTRAVYVFATMLAKVLREEEPDHVVVVFDAPGRTFRHELYADYKATRDAQPEDLSVQFPIARELVQALGLPILEVEGCEADDVIATLVARAPETARISIVTTDRDLMQLVNERVTLLDGIRERRFGPAEVEKRFGVPPERVLDLRALVGDSSDNIPGVKGVGEKTAAQLLGEYGDLENLLAHAGEIRARRPREALVAQAAAARLSKELATLRRDVALPLDFDALERREPDAPHLRRLYQRLEFGRLLEALGEAGAAPAGAGAAPPQPDVAIVRDAAGLAALAAGIGAAADVGVLVLEDPGTPLSGTPAGLAFGPRGGRATYAPIGAAGIELAQLVETLRPALGAPGRVAWVGADTKRVQALLVEHGLEPELPHFDVGVAGALVDPAAQQGLAALAARALGWRPATLEELTGRGARARPVGELPAEDLARLAASQLAALGELVPRLAARLEADGLARLFEEVELPLTRVLARMECAGVRVDESVLESLSLEFGRELRQLEDDIYRVAGEPFLISSPKQLQQILFEKLKLPPVRKTKTGYSTDESVLEQLAASHELPARILAYRRLAKLKNTYVDALPPLVDPRTGRIHPTFHQLGAATGRLSATQPNVQNIPIRTAEGVRIREAFVPAEGHVLVSADYSQVELRILAHFSRDESLIEAFRRGVDVHRQTAAEVRGIDPAQVGPDERAAAKAINFGIIYGQSAFGLAQQLGIAAAEARETIDVYFERYRGVRRFLDETIAVARRVGFVTTLLGRRRYLPDLASRNRALRGAAERMAVNSVIQGTAADLIKKAMVEVDAALRASGSRARMILQVHDELVFEVPGSEAEACRDQVRERMENVLALRVPLVVDVGIGKNWREAH
jgi:DNA polymerase-1